MTTIDDQKRGTMISKEMFVGATAPTMHLSGDEILRRMSTTAHDRALEAFTAAPARPLALEFPAALEGEPLQKAREAAVEPEAAVVAARDALTKEQKGIAGRLA